MREIFQYIQFQLEPFKIWLQFVILQKDKQPDRWMVEIDLQTNLKDDIINLVNFLINKYQIKDFKRLFIHCGTGDFHFLYNNKQTEPISLENLIPKKVEIIRNIVSTLIKLKKSDFDDTDLFYVKLSPPTIEQYKNSMRKNGIFLTDKEAQTEIDKSKIELDKFVKARPDLRKLKEK